MNIEQYRDTQVRALQAQREHVGESDRLKIDYQLDFWLYTNLKDLTVGDAAQRADEFHEKWQEETVLSRKLRLEQSWLFWLNVRDVLSNLPVVDGLDVAGTTYLGGPVGEEV